MKCHLKTNVSKLQLIATTTQWLVGGSLLLLGSSAWAVPFTNIYNNLGPDDAFHASSYLSVVNPVSGLQQDVAMSFTVAEGGDFTLGNIKAGLGGVGGITLSLAENNSESGTPGSVLTSMHGTVNNRELYTFNDLGETTLFGGETYWVVAVADPGTDLRWFYTSDLGPGNSMFSFDEGSTWNSHGTALSLQLNGVFTPVPEPTSYAFAGLGVLGMVCFARRRRNQATPSVE